MTEVLHVYVWDNVLEDYTAGCAIAIATSKEEAADILAGNIFQADWYAARKSFHKELLASHCHVYDVAKGYIHHQYGCG